VDTEELRQHFRTQVSDYAGLMTRLIPFYDQQRDLIVRLIPSRRSATLRVLDLGCGPGLLSAAILREFSRARVTAFDLTEEMLESCRAVTAHSDRMTYQLGDFRADDFGNQYDVIVASLSLHHLKLSERPAFFHRAYASLMAGGVLIASEVIVDESPIIREQQYRLWQEFMLAQGEDGMFWYQKHLIKDHPAQISTLVSMLSEAGFAAAGCFWRYLNFAIIGAHKSIEK
jgi:tRNA (cmo5U34)-methyltransferase